MKKMFVFAVLVAAMFTMASCNVVKSDASVFEGKKMILVSFAEGEVVPAELQEPVFIMFDKDEMRVNGYSGCNRFFGGYEINEGVIGFSNIGCTRMMCDPVSNEVEAKVMNILNTTNRFETTEHSVIFYNGEDRLGEFCSEDCHAACQSKVCVEGEQAAVVCPKDGELHDCEKACCPAKAKTAQGQTCEELAGTPHECIHVEGRGHECQNIGSFRKK